MLASIVSRLLSLADLAERSALRSPWVRWCVLWAAWQANALLRFYLEDGVRYPAGRRWSPVMTPVSFGTVPADAQDLADSLRAFALVVQAMAAQLRRLSFLQQGQASDEAGKEGGLQHGGRRHLPDAAASPVEVRDTS